MTRGQRLLELQTTHSAEFGLKEISKVLRSLNNRKVLNVDQEFTSFCSCHVPSPRCGSFSLGEATDADARAADARERLGGLTPSFLFVSPQTVCCYGFSVLS